MSRWIAGLGALVLSFAAAQAEDGIVIPAGPVKLVANFTAPEGHGPFPAAVIIAGAGPAMRNDTALLTAALDAEGIAVIRYDKRGCGDSSGNFAAGALPDFMNDAAAIVNYVKTRADVDRGHIALVGLSQGAVISPAIAVNDGGIAALVLLGVPAMRLDRASELQWEIAARAHAAKSDEEAMDIAKPALADAVAKGMIPQNQVDSILVGFATKAAREAQTYDPAVALRQVKVPVLALTGSLDQQVPAKQNLPIVRESLAGNPDVTVSEMPGLNHIFQVAKTGSAEDWGKLNQPAYANPEMLKLVTAWLATRLR